MKQELVKREMQARDNTVLVKALENLLYAVAGFLTSGAAVFGSHAPFGVAFLAAVPKKNTGAALLGALAGYLVPSTVENPLKYVAALIAVVGVKWALEGLPIIQHIYFNPVLALLSTAATGISIVMVGPGEPLDILMVLADSVLAGCGAFFAGKTMTLIEERRTPKSLNGQELACALISAGVLLMALCAFDIGGVSPGRILAALLVLLCAHYGGAAAGAVAGVSTGLVIGLAGPDMSHLTGAFSFGGLMAGVFSPMGRIGCALALVISNGIGALVTGAEAGVLGSLYETFAATVIFMLLPKSLLQKGALLLGDTRARERSEAKDTAIGRIRLAAETLDSVSGAVEEVSKRLIKIRAGSLSEVYDKALADVCAQCEKKNSCWNIRYTDTMNALNDFSLLLKTKGQLNREEIPNHFVLQCENAESLLTAVNNEYREFAVKHDEKKRMEEIKSRLSRHFDGVSRLLKNISEEMEAVRAYDNTATDRVRGAAVGLGFSTEDVSCRLDKYGHMTVELVYKDGQALSVPALAEAVAEVCGRVFEEPNQLTLGGVTRLILTERANWRLQIGVAQHAFQSGALCGDACESFTDSMGQTMIVLSDGMGSGGRAAIDGAMTAELMTRLIKAGFAFENALDIVNNALRCREGEESLATVDLVCFDLFTGQTEFFKAGAHYSYIKKGNEVARVQSESLPIGILRELNFEKTTEQLNEKDVVVLLSDGVDAEGWLEQELQSFRGGSPQRLAERLLDLARANRKDGHDDDVTVVVGVVQKS